MTTDLAGWVIELHGDRNLIGLPDEELGLSPVFEFVPTESGEGEDVKFVYFIKPVATLVSITALAVLCDPIARIEISSLAKEEIAILTAGVNDMLDVQDQIKHLRAGMSPMTQQVLPESESK